MSHFCNSTAMLLALTLIPGCSSTNDQEAPEPATIAWISKSKTITVYDPARLGAKLAGEELTAATGSQVTVEISEPAEPQGDLQNELIRAAIDNDVDAIALSVSDPATATPLIDEAVDKGKTVITWDIDAPDSKRHSFLNMDQQAAGQETARLIAKLIGGTGKVIVVAPLATNPPHIERMAALQQELATTYPNIELLPDVIECSRAVEVDTEECTTLLDPALAAHPDVAAFYFSRGLPLRSTKLAANAPNWIAAVKAGQVKFHRSRCGAGVPGQHAQRLCSGPTRPEVFLLGI
ncbi:MAG: substrate-binding domain-containing protein [Polyangiaceae bacterium]